MTTNIMKFLLVLAALLLSHMAGAVTYTYDDLNRLTSATFGSEPPQIYNYDAAGNLLTRTTSGAPGTPSISTVAAGNGSASITFTAPMNTGGSAITGYTVTSAPAGGVDTNAGSTALTHTMTGLSNGVSYTFTAIAANSAGTGAVSAASSAVTPVKVTPTITWGTPVAITYGTALSATQLSASASVAGSFAYTPAPGTAPNAGIQTLSVIFTPTDTASYNSQTGTVNLTVNKASQTIGAISFLPATVAVGGTTNVNASSGATGNLITFISTSPSICSISGSTLVGIAAGTCIIAANQTGDANYNAAAQVTQAITIDIASVTFANVSKLAAGEIHTCALTTAGGVRCWGYNFFGQLGDGSTTNRLTSVDVFGLADGVTAIAAGNNHTCALTTAGGVRCWGYNVSGQLGNGSVTNRLTPVDVTGLTSGVAAIAADGSHTCALTVAGGVKCWGSNIYGELGDNSTTSRLIPVDVVGLASGVSAIAAGSDHTCALTTAGGVKCWGNNYSRQLGDGSTTSRLIPVDVTGLTSVASAIAAGYSHTCALTAANGVMCWGYNGDGRLGDNSTTTRLTPVGVTGLASGVATIVARNMHTCVLTTTGGVKCWGYNADGRLGDNSTTDRLTPVDVMGLTNGVAAIVAGAFHTCALTVANGVKCWGSNSYGELGDNSTTNRFTPVDVLTMVPNAPVIGTATPGNGSASIALAAPSNSGGAAITGYTVTSSPAGGVDVNAGSTALTHTITGLTNGTAYTFTVKASNSVGDSAWSLASNPVTPSNLTSSNLLIKPDFENAVASWTQTSSGGNAIVRSDTVGTAHSGSYFARLGGYNSGTDTLYQDVAIPASAQSAYVRFWFKIATTESSASTTAYDGLTVDLYSAATGVKLATLTTLSNLNATAGLWMQSSQFDVSAYKGQTVRLKFTASTDSSLPTEFFIDDVELASVSAAVSPPGAPTAVSAVVGNGQATVSFTAPTNDGGSAITGYTVTSNPAGGVDVNAGSTALTHTVTGLSNGISYTFTVTANNIVGTSQASAASSGNVMPTPVKTYTDNGDGTVTDPTTGLTWMRCAMGQIWSGSTCTGTANTYTWDQATALTPSFAFANKSDWRLPNIRELQTIVDRTRANPAIDTVAFPNTPSSYFWSGSPYAYSSYSAWYVGFYNGRASDGGRSGNFGVRLVRGGQSLALLSEGRADSDYADNGDGTVTHKPTGLIWKRCSEGQTWTGLDCSGNPSSYTWDQAKALTGSFAFKSDWRVPSEEELFSLVDYTKYGPTINTALFPNTVIGYYWSGSPDASSSSSAWNVTFYNGSAYGSFYRSNSGGVRLVRGGQSLGSLAPPGAPSIGAATAGNGSAVVNFTSSIYDGGSVVTGYTVTSSPSGITASGTVSPITVTGLTNGIAYTFTVTATNIAWTSAASAESNSVTPASVPSTPTIGAVTAGNGSASIAFSAPTNTGGSAITGYTATCGSQTRTGSNSPITVTGLSNGVVYTCTVAATNAAGTSAVSATSNSVMPMLATPDAPSIGMVTPGNAQASVFFTAPGNNGGAAITGYTVTSSPSGITATGTSSSITVTGLANGTAYTFTVTASNSVGAGAASIASSAVMPHKASQTIGAIIFSPASLAVGGTTTVSASATSSDLTAMPVVVNNFSSLTLNVCTVSGSSVTGVTAGTCTIAANQAGNANYNAATQVTQSFTIGKANQAVSFAAAPAIVVNGTGVVSATATSALSVILSSTTPSVCSISGSTVNGIAAGTCTIAANQAGNANYNAAAQATQVITIGKANQTVSFGTAPTVVVGGADTVSATATSALATSFTSTTQSVCTVSGSTVTGVAAGACTLAANQAGDANYNAAAQVTQSITIGTGSLSLPLLLEQGWNLLGNSLSQPIGVATMLGDPATITTVWKWDTATSGWQFYAPSMASEALQTYASGKGYAVLTVINPGEGYWVNARIKASLGTLSGAPFRLGASDLKQGWNLVATGNDVTPSAFNLSLTNSLTPPPNIGTVPINLTTLWAWDNLLSKWYFYSPQLEGNGTLASYIASKGYMDFAQFNAELPQYNKKLGNGTGFWVNRP